MINILTNSNLTEVNGPSKVINNLIKGLYKIKYPYVLNKNINYSEKSYIPNSKRILIKNIWRAKSKVIIGPNLYVLPRDIEWFIKPLIKKSFLYVQPCDYVIDLWESDFNLCKLKTWAVGIDTELFKPSNKLMGKNILIYHKLRKKEELDYIKKVLDKRDLKYNEIIYGHYKQDEYIEILDKTTFIIWHGRHESQGIALQEAMAKNIPILVMDVKSLNEEVGANYKYPNDLQSKYVTAAPYFDHTCGIKVSNIEELEIKIEEIIDKIKNYEPRNYVIENLSLEKKAQDFVELWNIKIDD